jgi:glycerol uptake facilitator protein
MRDEPELWQKLVAEFLGTGLLVLFGAGAVTATFTLQPNSDAFSEADLGIIGLAFAIVIAAVIYAVGRVSGAHINPAVTIGLAVRNHIDWVSAAGYIVAQLLGALGGAFTIALIFGGQAATAGILGVTSYNTATTSVWQALIAEAIGTAVLVFTIYGVAVDKKAPTGWAGLIIGLIVGGVIMVIGPVTGASINPARTFGPMLAQAWLGGPNLLDQIWVYIVGPVVGGIVGAFVYDALTIPRAAPTEIPVGEKAAERQAPTEG